MCNIIVVLLGAEIPGLHYQYPSCGIVILDTLRIGKWLMRWKDLQIRQKVYIYNLLAAAKEFVWIS